MFRSISHQVIHDQQQLGPQAGQCLKLEKHCILLGVVGDHQQAIQRQAQYSTKFGIPLHRIHIHPDDAANNEQHTTLADNYGTTCLGIPIGDARFVHHAIDGILSEMHDDVHKLIDRCDGHRHLMLHMLTVVLPHTVTFLLRGLPPCYSLRIAQKFSDLQREVLGKIAGAPLDDMHYDIACSPHGLGLPRPEDMCDAAFVASFTACIDEIDSHCAGFRTHLRQVFTGEAQSPSLYVNEYVQAVHRLHAENPLYTGEWFLSRQTRDMRELQRHLLKPRRKLRAALADQQAKSMGTALYRRFLSATHPDCIAWVRAMPYCPANTLSNAEIGTAVRNRLLMPHPFIPAGRGCICPGEHTTLDSHGIHLEKCKVMHSLTVATHDAVVAQLEQFLRCSGVRCRREVLNVFLDGDKAPDKRRLDLVLDEPGEPRTLIDVSVISPVTKTQEHNMAGIPSDIEGNLKEHARAKERKYGEEAKKANLVLLPLMFENTGRPGPQCQALIDKAVNRYHERTGFPAGAIRQHWMTRIQLDLQRHVAQALLLRARRINSGFVPANIATESLISRDAATQPCDLLASGQEGPGPPQLDTYFPDPTDDSSSAPFGWRSLRT